MDIEEPSSTQDAPSKEVIVYVEGDLSVGLRFDEDQQGIWATAQDMADVFQTSKQNIGQHIKQIFSDEELYEGSVVKKFFTTASDGKKYSTKHYNLDMIISVGFRVNSKKAVKFRQWSNSVLKTYLEQGYVINEKALRESPDKINKLAAEIRALRSEEKQVYLKVRECFKLSASEYTPSSQQVKSFYALLQDKFHHAVTGVTGSKLIMDRANHQLENMGLQTLQGKAPTLKDATVGKNYLEENELYRMHLLSEQFLLYAESTALAKKQMTMKSLINQLDRLLILNEYDVFTGYTDSLKEEAEKHARQEHSLYKKRKKLESLGIEYDWDLLATGEYDEILEISPKH